MNEWLMALKNFEWVVNLVAMWICPSLHEAGSISIEKTLEENEGCQESWKSNVSKWPSICSGVSIVSNRITQAHFDNKGYDNSYDFLLSGGYHTNCQLEVKSLGAKFLYGPGAFVAIYGKFLKHEVSGDWEGDRFCYAHYFRDSVHKLHGCQRVRWVEFSDFSQHMGSTFKTNLLSSAK